MENRWVAKMVTTPRGIFEVFIAGTGDPICVTHYYSAFTKRGNYFADMFLGFQLRKESGYAN